MNTYTAFQRYLIGGLCAASVMAAPAWAAPNRISARLDRLTLPLGESAQLAIIVKGSQPVEPNIPAVDGLEITPLGQQSSMQVINGAVSVEVRYVYQVTPNRPGSFTIPAIGASGVGSTQPVAFQVERTSGGQSAGASRPGSSPLPALNFAPPQEEDAPTDAKSQPAFLHVVLPKRELTVGELVPVELKACFPAGMTASLNGLPMLAGGAFSLNKLGKDPEQTREIIDGRPYNVITWSSALSAVQAGDYPLNLELPVIVRVQEKIKRGGGNPFKDFFGDESPFDDSTLDDFFGQVTEKPLVLHSDSAPVKIQPLPVQGRPADFSGAVGKFDLSAGASVAKAISGDPITLTIKITGQGNFDRVTTNGLVSSAAWKGYKPNSRFEPADTDGFAGTKVFEQTIVPTQSGSSVIPTMSFSYFDPEIRDYVTKTTSPIAIEIAPGSTTAAASAPTTPSISPATVGSANGLMPDHLEIGRASSLHPLVLAPWFLVGNALMVTVTCIGLLARRWRQKRANDPERLRTHAARAAVREAVSAMDEAIKNRDGTGFFQSARRAVTDRLAERWCLPSSRITPAEIRARLNSGGEKLCALFQRGDEVLYSHEKVTATELTQWRSDIAQQLTDI
jgi:BatD DUF11 like domain